MFTGIVRELGTVGRLRRLAARRRAPETAAAAELGDSVAMAGVCLTVVANEDGRLAFDAVAGDALAHDARRPRSRATR